MVFKKLAQKLSEDREKCLSVAMNPIEVDFENREQKFLSHLTRSALDLYEHRSDVKKFTKLVLSDPENKSHDRLVEALFSHGIVNIESTKLSENKNLLKNIQS